jgi:hypothetical protein
MTEEQAKLKWCPMVRPGSPQRADDFGCVGSNCMMWRWAEKPNPEWKPDTNQMWPPRDPRFEPPMMICHETEGYCGLAGRAGALQEL